MSSAIEALCEHNRWANQHLFDLCAGLDETVLNATAVGVFGTVHHTLLHIANSEADYYALLTSTKTEELKKEEVKFPPVPEIAAFYKKFGDGLVKCAREIPGDRLLEGTFDDGLWYRLPASGLFIQAINHASEHRTQIATILTQQGVQPPRIDGWEYMDTVMMPGGAWERTN